jgi:hypothetical protein
VCAFCWRRETVDHGHFRRILCRRRGRNRAIPVPVTASNDGTLLAYYVRDIRPGVSGAVFAAKRTWTKANVPTIKAWRAAFDE